MKFAYYQRLSKKDKAIYDRSDAIRTVTLPDAPALREIVSVLKAGLDADDRVVVEAAEADMVNRFTVQVGPLPFAPRGLLAAQVVQPAAAPEGVVPAAT